MSASSDSQLERQLSGLAADLATEQAVRRDEENVVVMVRCRPAVAAARIKSTTSSSSIEQKQQQHSNEQAVKVIEENGCVQIVANSSSSTLKGTGDELSNREFYYDQVFGPQASNELVYMQSARRLVEAAFLGYNSTIFLYGQTGTGKTFTHSSLTTSSFEHLFSLIKRSDKNESFLIKASYYELYNEEIHDLLTKNKNKQATTKALELRESKSRGVYIKDLSCFLVANSSELNKLKRLGDKRRLTAATKMNEHSSRSHSIFSITIETTTTSAESVSIFPTDNNNNNNNATDNNNNKLKQETNVNSGGKGNQRKESVEKGKKKRSESVRLGRLHLVDLAGSERQAKSGSLGTRLKEASQINLSLTCLSLVIRALTDPQSTHIPYRNSKLTRLLSSSLGGNSKTLLIACVAPEQSNLDETLNTLRFASRTKRIKNKARVNENPKDALLRKYKLQISELRKKLLQQQQQKQQREVIVDDDAKNDDSDKVTEKQLEMLKAKIMIGGENLLDKVELHERLLEVSRAELEEKRQQEAKLKRQLDERGDYLNQVQQSKGSLESQCQQLDSQLKRALSLFKRGKLEKRDLAIEHEQLKESLLQGIKATSKEIKYVDCIIENFIPSEQLNLINAYAQYDDESDEWQIKYIAMSGNNIARTTNSNEQKQTTAWQALS